jgi:hypothetical protein
MIETSRALPEEEASGQESEACSVRRNRRGGAIVLFMTARRPQPVPVDEASPVPPHSEERASASEIDPIEAAMERAPEVAWLTPEQRAECDQALEDLHAGRSKLLSREEMFEGFDELRPARE